MCMPYAAKKSRREIELVGTGGVCCPFQNGVVFVLANAVVSLR